MFVGEWGEGDGREPSALQPVHSGGVNSYCLFCCNVGTILWVRGGKGEEGREGGREEGGGDEATNSKQGSTTHGRSSGDGGPSLTLR